jgi:hypothetical protein
MYSNTHRLPITITLHHHVDVDDALDALDVVDVVDPLAQNINYIMLVIYHKLKHKASKKKTYFRLNNSK